MEIDYDQLTDTNVADILLVTATLTETKSLLDLFEPVCSDGILIVKKNDKVYNLGVFGGYNVVHCQCTNMGTQEVGSSTLTTASALTDWPSVKFVIMVGIAFGMYNEERDIIKQNFGDVLVAERIFPYENQRLNPNGETKYRGTEHFSDKNLVDAFTVVAREWDERNYNDEPTKVYIVPMLTGEKLVDNLEWRNEIKAKYPEYKGGEMEGMGIASSSESAGKPWILVKSICDFADGKKGTTSSEEELKQIKQTTAANLAVLACYRALQTVNVQIHIKQKLNFYYRGNLKNIDDILFLTYRKEYKPYYIIRNIDKELLRHILNKHIWITGISGVGKSELLRHALVESDVKYVYIDLSLCDRGNIGEMFHSIYEGVAEFYDEVADSFISYRESIKRLCEILEWKSDGNRLYVFIEEIPFEETSEDFVEFVRKYAGLIIFSSTHLQKSKAQFVLSSIAMPSDALDTYRDKIQDLVYFASLNQWQKGECIALVDTLSKAIGLNWKNNQLKEKFIESLEFSPRKIKNALKTCCSLSFRQIDEIICSKLTNGY